MRSVATILGFLAVLGSSRAAEPPREWVVDGVARQAVVVAPTAGKGPAPLVFFFHGHGGTAAHAARTYAFQAHWPEAVVVYPQGLNTPGKLTDPEGKKSGWQSTAGDQHDRDLKFFDAVLKSLTDEAKVDPKRVYATGHSNGGAFTYLLWAKRGEAFAAVAPSAAIPPPAEVKNLKPKPALHVAGKTDPLVKWAWQDKAMSAVRKLNGCDEEGKPWAKAGDLVGTEYPSGTGTPFVSLIAPGGHTFAPEAAKLIVKFFQDHPAK